MSGYRLKTSLKHIGKIGIDGSSVLFIGYRSVTTTSLYHYIHKSVINPILLIVYKYTSIQNDALIQ